MAHFSNGFEGDRFQERWCYRCVHWQEDEIGWNCPVWWLHVNPPISREAMEFGQAVLDTLILPGEENEPECAMFHATTREERREAREAARQREREDRYLGEQFDACGKYYKGTRGAKLAAQIVDRLGLVLVETDE